MNNVLKLGQDQIKLLEKILIERGLEKKEVAGGTAYRSIDCIITIYNTGKVLFQGKKVEVLHSEVCSALFGDSSAGNEGLDMGVQEALEEIKTWPRIGSDESGKGDFFGPLVTTAFLVKSKEVESELIAIGVKDSKKLSDKQIKELATKVRALGDFVVIKIGPQRYNELYAKFHNLNNLLAWSHARAIENVLEKNSAELIVADQFGDKSLIERALFAKGKNVKLQQRHKAEADVAVAAASILARDTFVNSIEALSREHGVLLPLGSGNTVIATAQKLAKEKGIIVLDGLAKTHFKTYDVVKSKF